jgi:hypothetical protein
MASTVSSHGDLTSEVLQALSQNDDILSSDAFPSQKSADVKSSLDRLASRSMITYETIDREEAVLEPEAQEIAASGSHEARVFEALRKAVLGLTVSELEAAVGDKNVVKVGQGKAFKSKWITKGKEGRLIASVSLSYESLLLGSMLMTADGLDRRYNTGTTANHTQNTNTSRSKSYHRLEEAQACQDAKGYKFQDPQRPQIRPRNG